MLNARHASGATAPVETVTLPGAHWEDQPDTALRVLGRIDTARGLPRPVYRSEAFVREYRVDDCAFDAVLARQGAEPRVGALRLLSRMRLVNSPNRLAHAIVSAPCRRQAAFVTTGDPARLEPLAQRGLVADLQETPPRNAPAADPSRVSRVLASGSLRLPGGQDVELRRLRPGAREVHRGLVREILRCERARIVAGEIDGPLADHEIAGEVSARCAVPASRRAVAFIRKELGVPNAGIRARRGCYLSVTAGFSSLRRVDPATLRAAAPRTSGVYELRVEPPGADYPAGRSPVICVGSSNNLRKRLLDQVGSHGRNAKLSSYLETGRAQVRWMLVPEGWRRVERRVDRHFVKTYGAPPVCNRMSP